jgi:hypothetical protein
MKQGYKDGDGEKQVPGEAMESSGQQKANKTERQETEMREIRKGICAAGAASLLLAALKLVGIAGWGWIVVSAPLIGALLAGTIIRISGTRWPNDTRR